MTAGDLSAGATASRAIDWASRQLCRLATLVCVAIIYVMLGLLVTQILMRYFLGSPPSWTEELAIILFAWLVLLYATVGVRERFHVAIEFLPETATLLRRASDRLVAALIFGFGFVTYWFGIAYVVKTSGQLTAALRMPIEVLYLSVPVCGALLMLHAVAIVLLPANDDGRPGE